MTDRVFRLTTQVQIMAFDLREIKLVHIFSSNEAGRRLFQSLSLFGKDETLQFFSKDLVNICARIKTF